MTRYARKVLGRRASLYLVAVGVGYLVWCHAWDTRIAPGYRATAERVRVKYEVGYCVGLPEWAMKP